MYLIAGLGNPGRRYAGTRHNAGFMLLDLVAAEAAISFHARGDVVVGEGRVGGRRAVLAKPQTYMNLSGRCVKRLVDTNEIDLQQLLVVYDDVALPLGTLRFRSRGSAGGQKGMRSVIEALGTSEVPRLRIGIGDPETLPADDLSDFVLARFSGRERSVLETVLVNGSEGVQTFVAEGIERAMALHNSSSFPEKDKGT